MRRWVLNASCAVAFGAMLVGCFQYDEPTCSFACGAGALCPEDYECRSDGYCHKQGSTDVCPFSDAATPADLSAGVEMPSDMPTVDGGLVDSGNASND